MDSWIKDLRFITMPTRHPTKGYEKEYDDSYKCWRSAWEKLRQEVKVNDTLYSDSFLIPDEMGIIFYQEKCVGFCSFAFGDMNSQATLDHSYFKGWTDLALQRLKNISPNVGLCSQFTVNPEFTGKNQVVRWKDIVSLANLIRFIYSPAGVLAGQLNLSRKMDEAAGQTLGATILEESIPYYYAEGINVQLVAYEREKSVQMIKEKNLEGLCEALWSKHIHLSDYPVIKDQTKKLKIAA